MVSIALLRFMNKDSMIIRTFIESFLASLSSLASGEYVKNDQPRDLAITANTKYLLNRLATPRMKR
jgi:hypothetical protein